MKYVSLTRKDVHVSLICRILYLLLVALPMLCCCFAPSFGEEHRMIFVVFLTLTALQLVLLFFIIRAVLRLFWHFLPHIQDCLKVILCFGFIYLPVLEFAFLMAEEEEEILVPALKQPPIADMNSLTTSLCVFFEGIPSFSPEKLTFFLKEFGYHAKADCEQTIEVYTNLGKFTCALNTEVGNLYIFKVLEEKELEEPENFNIPQSSQWKKEQSYDYSSAAIVYDVYFNPFKNNELDVCKIIVSALKEIESLKGE